MGEEQGIDVALSGPMRPEPKLSSPLASQRKPLGTRREDAADAELVASHRVSYGPHASLGTAYLLALSGLLPCLLDQV